MRKFISLLLAMLMLFCLASCAGKPADSFTVNVICESEGIYQIFYSCYINGEYYGMGGMADYDGNELTEETVLEIVFTKAYFEELEDVSSFAIDFSPYGKDDTYEIGTTERLSIAAVYGESYTVVFSGDRESGFTAELQ